MVATAYLDIRNNKTEIFYSGEIKEFDGFDILKNIDVKNNTILFINNLKVFATLFPIGKETLGEYERKDGTGSDLLEYKIKNVIFRSFSALVNMQDPKELQEMFDNAPISVCMMKFIERLGKPEKVRYTLAYNVKRSFYEPIKEILWEETKKNKHYYYDFQTYKDMMAGNKAGILTAHKNKEFLDFIGFDKKSAYPSIIMNCDCFPTGHVSRITSKDIEYVLLYIKGCIKKKKWFKIIIEGNHKGFEIWYDKDQDVVAVDLPRAMSICILGMFEIFVDIIRTNKYRLYGVHHQGYCSKALRYRVDEVFKKKNSCEKGSFERFLYKTELDMIYGKGIQDYNFKNIKEVQDHFKGRGENYMCPEFSNLLSGFVQYEILKAIIKNGFTFHDVYADTDGLKLPKTDEVIKYFEEENKRIIEANKKSGFPSEIGVWDFEYECEKLYVVRPKIYCIQNGSCFEAKHAGVKKHLFKEFTNRYKGKEIETIKRKGFPFIREIFQLENGIFKTYYKISWIGKDD